MAPMQRFGCVFLSGLALTGAAGAAPSPRDRADALFFWRAADQYLGSFYARGDPNVYFARAGRQLRACPGGSKTRHSRVIMLVERELGTVLMEKVEAPLYLILTKRLVSRRATAPVLRRLTALAVGQARYVRRVHLVDADACSFVLELARRGWKPTAAVAINDERYRRAGIPLEEVSDRFSFASTNETSPLQRLGISFDQALEATGRIGFFF